MPAGTHEVLDQTREAVERRARILLAQLQELGDDPVKAVNVSKVPLRSYGKSSKTKALGWE